MSAKLYRKVPVEIRAEKFVRGRTLFNSQTGVCGCPEGASSGHLHTIHDGQTVTLQDGDWIIPEPDGVHFYPCKPEVFARTYEEIPGDPTTGSEPGIPCFNTEATRAPEPVLCMDVVVTEGSGNCMCCGTEMIFDRAAGVWIVKSAVALEAPAPEPARSKEDTDLLQRAWGLLANVSGGNWEKQHPDWKTAVEQWRDKYHATLRR